jgi:hypothetical protein
MIESTGRAAPPARPIPKSLRRKPEAIVGRI